MAKQTTKLHNKDDEYLVPKPKITWNVYQSMLIQEVLPAIHRVFPHNNRNVVIQQDGAKVHVKDNDNTFLRAGSAGTWNITIKTQPARSPELNVNNLII